MNQRSTFLLSIIAYLGTGMAFGQLVTVDDFAPRRADTIILERNWRTRDRIIISELEFDQGDTVTPQSLGISIKKIWNLQNFATVAYRWDSLPGGRSALILITRDAVTIRPVVSGRLMGDDDATVKLGIVDRNFLGRNILIEMRGQVSMNEPWFGELKFTIPRQLLWKNMSLGAGARSEIISSEVQSDQVYVTIVNPFHEDYRYTFSPDLEAGLMRHQSELRWFRDPVPDSGMYDPFNRPFWYFRITESVGTITHRRHQEEGYQVTGMIGTGIGLNKETQNYLEGSLIAQYDELIRPRLQFSARWQGHYSSSPYPSLWTRFGPANIRGIIYGDISGPVMQLYSAGLYYTWINRDYLAVEQSVFVQFASAWPWSDDWFSIKRHYAFGSGFQFTIPMFPAASLLITFSYSPCPKNWFYLEI